MRLLRAVVICAVFAAAASEEDKLREAIMMKSAEELKTICSKASIALPEDDPPIDTLRALVYEYGQRERPGNLPIKPWSRIGMPASKAKPAKGGSGMRQYSSAFFQKMDKNGDGKLSQAELQPLIDQTNERAKAMGEPVQENLWTQLDADADGYVSQSESESFFGRLMGGGASAKGSSAPKSAAAGNPLSRDPQDVARMMFKNLDKDQSGRLSKEEFKSIQEKTAEQWSKESGEPPTDWFAELDKDGDEGIDTKELQEFFALMQMGGLMGQKPKEEL